MAESPREQFLATAAEVLYGMNVGPRYWGGSYPGPLTVERIFRQPGQVNQFPHLCLVQEGGAHLERFLHDSEHWIDRFRVVIVGYVDGTAVAAPSTWMERVNRDCKVSLRAALVPPNGVLVARAGLIEFDEEDVEFWDAVAAFVLPMTVHIDDNLAAAA